MYWFICIVYYHSNLVIGVKAQLFTLNFCLYILQHFVRVIELHCIIMFQFMIVQLIDWLIARLIVICGSWIAWKIKDLCKWSTLVCYISILICKIVPNTSLTASWSNTFFDQCNFDLHNFIQLQIYTILISAISLCLFCSG